MSVVMIGELIDRAAAFEIQLEQFYSGLRDRALNDGVRLVTYYLARRKRHLPQTLKSYSQSQIDHIRHTPFKYEDTVNLESSFEGKDLPSDTDAATLLDIAIEFVNLLITFYNHILQKPLGEETRKLFESLVKIEEKDIIELKKIRAMNYF